MSESRHVKSWNRYRTPHLGVEPDVMGAAHVFGFDHASVTIRLPKASQASKKQDAVASVSRWKPNGEPSYYCVHEVDVEVDADKSFQLPAEVLQRPPNQFDLVPESDQQTLNLSCRDHSSIARRAFDYWLRVIRWTTDDYRIGRGRIETKHTGWGTYLVDVETDHRVWCGPQVFTAEGYCRTTPDHWSEAATRLSNLEEPPIYIQFKHDAERWCSVGEYSLSIAMIAVACETFLRTKVLDTLPKLPAKIEEFVDNANINQNFSHFFPETLDESAKQSFKSIQKELRSLFACRNDLMHSGVTLRIDRQNCERFLGVTKSLIADYS